MKSQSENQLLELTKEETTAIVGGMLLLITAKLVDRSRTADGHKIDLSVCDAATFDHDACLG